MLALGHVWEGSGAVQNGGAGAELEEAELVFVVPPAPLSRKQSRFCGSQSLGWSRSTSEVFGRTLAGVVEGAGFGALPKRPPMESSLNIVMFPLRLISTSSC